MPDGRRPADGVLVVPYRIEETFAGADAHHTSGGTAVHFRLHPLALTDDQGRFRAEGLPEGDYRVTVLPRGYVTAPLDSAGRFELVGELEAGTACVRPRQVTSLPDIVLVRAGALAVAVTPSGDGAPVDGLSVLLRAEGLEPSATLSRIALVQRLRTQTDGKGECRFSGLPPGRYRLTCCEPSGRSAQQSETVRSGESARVTLQLQRGAQ